ncbi:MAG TPA: hypothetical protein VLA23_01375 [Candidatus Limnocylindrales bacterium]|nr:hypothetical protein [Candidatus Limnocylindrales bacterium]
MPGTEGDRVIPGSVVAVSRLHVMVEQVLPWEETPVGWATEHAVQGVIVGLVWGGATVLARPGARSVALPEAVAG